MSAAILIVDDEKNTREGLKEAVARPGRKILLAEDGFRAEEIMATTPVDLVLADLKMPGMSGLDLLERVRSHTASTLFVIMTAYGTVETAVEAMKQGAYDYLTKPVNLAQLENVITRALQEKRLEQGEIIPPGELKKDYGFEDITGRSAAMENIFKMIKQISHSKSTVLITGESGTGKELVARAIHNRSPRQDKPFIPVHCAALAPTLLESELFGHEKGAFTGATNLKKGRFELADGGTVFLDEVSEIPLDIQVKLLRFLESHEFERVGGTKQIKVDIRLLAATNADLEKAMKRGAFREDLYYRLNVVPISLPPLRQRRDDIPLLVDRFIREISAENHRRVNSISPRALRLLEIYNWPGNVRELRNYIESMVILAKKEVLDVDDLPPHLRGAEPSAEPVFSSLNIKARGKELIQRALQQAGNNKTEAARLLGISRRTLYRKIYEYGLNLN